MKALVTLSTAAAVLAAGTFAALASPQRDAAIPAGFGEQVEVPAAQVLSAKEMHQRGLAFGDLVTVTKAPQGPVDTSRGS